MANYLHPGVYVEEISSGSKPIEGGSTSITAFVGITFRNSTSEPTLIGGMNDYIEKFGPILKSDDDMGLAVQAFYLNGGGAAYICPLSKTSVIAKESFGGMTVSAKASGKWGNELYIRITKVIEITDTPTFFDMEVGTRNESGTFYTLEKFEGLSLSTTEASFVGTLVNDISSFIIIDVDDETNLPNLTNDDGDSDGKDDGLPLAGGTSPSAIAGTYTEFYNETLRKIRSVRIIVLPGQSWAADGSGNAIISATRAHCESMKNRVLILDPPEALELSDAGIVTTMELPTSTYTVLYYPWVGISNPVYHPEKNPNVSKTVNVAPSAIAAGMWAKIDRKRGVWKAPAGVETQLTGAASLEFHVEDLEQDQLNPLGVNCIRKLPSYGSVFWGSRSLATKADPEWRYVPVRRTAIYIEDSIFNGIQWAVFEPNSHMLWSSLRANIGSFMNGMFRAGAFQGETSKDAYFVRCGLGDTMTQGDIDRGQVIVIVGFAPVKPAEFVIVRIQQKVGED